MINRSVVRIPLLPTVFKEYFNMFFKVVRKNISKKINRNIKNCRMRVPVPSCSRSMISGQNLTGAGKAAPRKFKGGICCDGHLAITYGGEILVTDQHSAAICVQAVDDAGYSLSYCTFRFGAIIRCNLCTLLLTCDSQRHNQYAWGIWVRTGKATYA